MLASGADLTVVSKVLGHSSHSFTADTYAHLLAGVGKRAADAADALVPRRLRDQSVTSRAPEREAAPLELLGERGRLRRERREFRHRARRRQRL